MSLDSAHGTDMERVLARFETAYPLACQVTRRIAQDRMLRGAIEYLVATEDQYIPRISPALTVLSRVYAQQGSDMSAALEAVLEYTHVYMRHQVSFLANGAYSNTNFEDVFKSVYDNEELMLGTYLPGLFLTQLFWPVHFRVLSLYERDFLGAAASAGSPQRLVEFGVGHGMTLLMAKQRFPRAAGLAFDVSRHSLTFAERILRTSGADLSGFRFERADVVRLVPDVADVCDLGTMGEILEHVEAPQKALANFRTLLRAGGLAFITTVIDSNAIDHIYQFSSQEEIDDMIRTSGFELTLSELIRPAQLRLSEEPGSDPTRYYAAIARAV